MRYDDIHGALVAGTATDVLPAWAHRVLDDIAAGRLAVAAVRHPLGFLCLPVERTGDLGVCLHIWSPEAPAAPATTSPVHCHSWELMSFVLYGALRNTRARVDELPAGAGAGHRVFQVVSRSGEDELHATPRTVRFSPGDSAVHRAGDTYTLPAGVFHSTDIEDGPDAATVALGRQTPGGGDLSLGPLDTPTHRTRRTHCDPGEIARAAHRSARLLEAAHDGPPGPPGPAGPAPDDGRRSARL
ncbi:hypothetical protein [Spirillospora sp. NPDC047279]|uniref:hypothetical protein n=1 Tax=Spirillospora sp. NPDC047279 TaxID=3155478 RepID=UPI0033D4C050